MATIHVNRSGTTLGQFAEAEIREGLRARRFLGTDLGWRDGMATWQPLSQFTEFAEDLAAGAAAPEPGSAPQAPPAAATVPVVSGAPAPTVPPVTPQSGLPWDERQQKGFLNAFIETMVLVLTKPDRAFTAMKRQGGLTEPLIYGLVGGCAGGLVAGLFSLLTNSLGLVSHQRNGLGALIGMGAGSIVFLVLVPFFVVIGLFVWSGIVHLCLMMLGGARQPFETSFRVLAFSQGSTAILQMVPVCGGIVALIWNLVVTTIGLAKAHETDIGRAVAAVLLPLLICCGGVVAIAVIAAGSVNWH